MIQMMTKYCCVLMWWITAGKWFHEKAARTETVSSRNWYVLCGCECVCGWVGRCVVCVYMGVGEWMYGCVCLCGWMGGYVCVGRCAEMGRGSVWCECRGCQCQSEYFWKGMQMLILKSFGSVTVLVTLWPFTLVCSSVCDAMWRVHQLELHMMT